MKNEDGSENPIAKELITGIVDDCFEQLEVYMQDPD